ncbi:MAG: alpha/beta hydrolase, partial [Pseudomonadota bacterium]|nr:alpha/beta hydrolase [Pseudomonadota bacterium]
MIDKTSRALLNALLARSEELRTPCGDGEMVWRVWGRDNSERPPVVLLHGGFGAWNHWVRNIPIWEKYYRLVAADLPGCGDSASLPRPYDAEDLAKVVSAGIDVAVPAQQPFDLVTFSFGGMISGLIAHKQAQRIRSLTLIGSPVLGLTGTGPANELVVVRPDLPIDEAAPLHRSNLQKLMVCNPEAADELALTIQLENMSKARLRSRGIARSMVLADSLRDLPCQLNCIFGDADVTLDPDLASVRAYVEDI